jgi:uncharacterized protein (DUF362 family)
MKRREFLSTTALAAGLHLARGRAPAATNVVGIGHDSNAYTATRRAINASGQWSALNLAGKTIVIKPNLVWPAVSTSGITVDPEVVRAIVDLSLNAGAAQIILAETSALGANWTVCGYDYFRTYDPQNRIQLVDPAQQPSVLTPVPGALSWPAVYTPQVFLSPGAVFINVAKLKVHWETVVSLSTKNLFGVPAVNKYPSSNTTGVWAPRLGLHDRGTHPSIVDMNRLLPTSFAVIDGIWGMEGFGPVLGSPVSMNTVLAGTNTVAVDRVALYLMGISQNAVPHLTFASRLGMGPADLSGITAIGDPVTPRPFSVPPSMPPALDIPVVVPSSFTPRLGQTCSVRFWYGEPISRQILVVRFYDTTVNFDLIRTVKPQAAQAAGFEIVSWDGRADDGSLAPPGRYAFYVRAAANRPEMYTASAVGWVSVLG